MKKMTMKRQTFGQVRGRKARVGFAILAAAALVIVVPIQAHHNEGHDGGTGQDDWPENATGPFQLKEVLTDPIISFDGTSLETTIFVPDLAGLPKKVRAPVVLVAEGYAGSCSPVAFLLRVIQQPCIPASDSEEIYNGLRRVSIKNLVAEGYAVAYVNVRGTGSSGGCYDHGGLNQQKDMVAVIEDLAARDWSNGRVAMYGHSWGGWTPFMAAVHAPEALRTIVASGVITNPYFFAYTPEGAVRNGRSSVLGTFGLFPPFGGGVEDGAAAFSEVLPERICLEVVQSLTESHTGQTTGIRNGGFWEERRLAKDLGNATASVLLAHGNDGHWFQYDTVWQSLPDAIDKRMLLGQWGHELPPSSILENSPFADDWEQDILFPWLDHYLKGRGTGSNLRLGTVDYHAQGTEEWRTSTAWPPEDRREEVLYFTPDGTPDGGLRPSPDGGSWSFVAYTTPPTATCPVEAGADAVVFTTPPATERVVLAGNPMAYLQTTSTLPGGTLTVDMFVTPEGGTCQTPPFAGGFDNKFMFGSADLRFHKGGYTPENFPFLPTDDPTPIRIDMKAHATVVPEGSSLLVKISGGGENGLGDKEFAPVLTIHGGQDAQASHLVLPLVEGSFGGEPPTVNYPEQPFSS